MAKRLLKFSGLLGTAKPLPPRKPIEEMTWADITVSTLFYTDAEVAEAKLHPERYAKD